MSHAEIISTISTITKYLIEFVETCHPTFKNMPICPLAKKARINDTINYQFVQLNHIESYQEKITQFKLQLDKKEVLFLLAEKPITNQEIETITDALTELHGNELQLFAFHPDSQFEMEGLFTRRMPSPGIIVQRNTDVEIREKALKKTRYYDNLTKPPTHTTANDPAFHIKEVPGKGKGLFTSVSWNACTNLFKLSGVIKPFTESSPLAIQVSEKECIESYPDYNDYIANHSCDPNCKIFFGDQTLMRSLRPIGSGEEITWDYESTELDMSSCSFDCKCGSSTCRGLILGARYRYRYPAWKLAALSR
jgi:hypothetical protein